MNDTYIQDQDVAPIDQPAELEDIRLNWSPPEFFETSNGPRVLRIAPPTPEFWEVWNRNKETLKTAGISCSPHPPDDDWRVEWWIDVSNDICINEGEFYTLSEVIDFVKQTLDKVSEQSQHNKLQYSSTDVYWLLHDMLRYVNQNVSGVFVLRQIQKGIYRVKCMVEDFAKQRSRRKLKAEVNRTAKYLAELTGRHPSWGKDE